MNTEFQDLPNVVSPKEVQTYFGISRSTTYRIFHDATFPGVPHWKPTTGAAGWTAGLVGAAKGQ